MEAISMNCKKALLLMAALALCGIGYSGAETKAETRSAMEPRISVIALGVSDLEKSFHFYKEGLGFPTKMTPEGGIVLFMTSGTRLFLYPYDKLGEDAGFRVSAKKKDEFSGFSLGHCVRRKELVEAVLSQAQNAGGKIVKAAKETSWGGYSGYFADPDGYLWEVAYADQWKFNADGSVKVE
jgi:uncharacterized protein